jgi:hypothetical protein
MTMIQFILAFLIGSGIYDGIKFGVGYYYYSKKTKQLIKQIHEINLSGIEKPLPGEFVNLKGPTKH